MVEVERGFLGMDERLLDLRDDAILDDLFDERPLDLRDDAIFDDLFDERSFMRANVEWSYNWPVASL